MLFRRDVVCGSKIGNAHTSSCGGFSLPVLLIVGLSTLALIFTVPIAWNSLTSPNQAQAQELTPEPTLIETATKIFTVNIPASFKELVTMAALEVEGETLFGGSVTFAGGSVFDGQITLQGDVFADGINIDLGSGEITASNVLYSLTEGDGIDISTGQTPTITNSDRGSSQNIFKKVKLGDDNIEADSNTDTLEFAAGSGISLSIDTSNDKLTISNSQTPGFVTSGTYAVLASGITRTGIGTNTPSNTLEVNSGTTDTSGITFTQLTSSSAAGVGGGKVLSVDSGGKIILVTDQTGSTPTAESVLPSATNGMTLYFNGTNWVASDNLFHDGGSVGISNAAPTSRFQVNTNLASKIGVIVQGYTSQTANLQEWRNSSGSILSYIDSNGVFNGSANTSGSLNPGFTTGSVAFQGASGLTQDNSNFFWNDTNNRLGIGTNSPDTLLTLATPGTPNLKTGISATGISWSRVADGGYMNSITTNGDITATPATTYYSYTDHIFNVNAATTQGLRISRDHPSGVAKVLVGSGTFANGTSSLLSVTGNAAIGSSYFGTNAPSNGLIVQGNVGIGRTSPSSALDVNGQVRALYSSGFGFYNGTALTANIVSNGNAELVFLMGTSSLERMRLLYNGNLGIGTSAPTSNLHVTGSYGDNALTTLNQTGPGSIFTASASGTTRMVLTNAGNVGIGTTSPSTLLHVYNSNSAGTNGITVDGTGYQFVNINRPSTSRYAQLSFRTAGASIWQVGMHDDSTEKFHIWDGTGNKFLTVVDNGTTGSIGIGTTSPNRILHVAQSDSTAYSGAIANTAEQVIQNTNTTNNTFSSLAFSSVDSGGSYLQAGRIASVVTNHTDAAETASLTFSTVLSGSFDERMRIHTNGNVGIGTITPGAMLEINTRAADVQGLIIKAFSGQSSNLQAWQDSSANILSRINQAGQFFAPYGEFVVTSPSLPGIVVRGAGGQTANIFRVQDSTSVDQLNVGPSGNVGIGIATALSKLHVEGLTTTALGRFNQHGAGDILTASASGTTRMVLTSAGNLGLGTNLPNASIETSGDIWINSGNSRITSTGITRLGGANYFLRNNGGLELGTPSGLGTTLRFSTENITRMTVASTGFIGIGTITPTSLFHVEGPTGSVLTRFNQTGSGDILTASASGTTRFVVTNSGNVGIGIAIPTGTLHTYKSANQSTIFESDTHNYVALDRGAVTQNNLLRFQTAGTDNWAIGLGDDSNNNLHFTTNIPTPSSGAKMTLTTTGNLGLGTTTFGTSAASVLAIAGSTAPTTSITNGIQMFAVDQAGSHELRVMDEAGNTTTLSPHNFSVIGDQSEEMAWSFYSERNSLAINADMTKALRLVEKLSGEKLVYLKDLESGFMLEDASDATHLTELADNGTIGEIAKWNYELWTYVGEVIFEKPVTFLADVRLKGRIFLSADQVGTVTIPAGSRSAKITFSRELPVKPILNLTPHQSLPNGITLTEITTQHFTLTLPDPLDHDVNINWLASLKNADDSTSPNVEILSPTPTPLASPSPLVTPSSSPIPTSQPSSSSATIEPTSSSTQSAEMTQ